MTNEMVSQVLLLGGTVFKKEYNISKNLSGRTILRPERFFKTVLALRNLSVLHKLVTLDLLSLFAT